jgi:hypothetical protein
MLLNIMAKGPSNDLESLEVMIDSFSLVPDLVAFAAPMLILHVMQASWTLCKTRVSTLLFSSRYFFKPKQKISMSGQSTRGSRPQIQQRLPV